MFYLARLLTFIKSKRIAIPTGKSPGVNWPPRPDTQSSIKRPLSCIDISPKWPLSTLVGDDQSCLQLLRWSSVHLQRVSSRSKNRATLKIRTRALCKPHARCAQFWTRYCFQYYYDICFPWQITLIISLQVFIIILFYIISIRSASLPLLSTVRTVFPFINQL